VSYPPVEGGFAVAATEEVSQWIARLTDGDSQAAQVLWEKYFAKLVRFARRKLDGIPLRSADEEDVALSAMHSFCRGMADHRFDQVNDRSELWKLLVTITARKACAQRRRQFAAKRGGGRVHGESIFHRVDQGEDQTDVGIGQILGHEPTPELANMVAEDCRRMLDGLTDPTLRQVAVWTLEGYTIQEIADRLKCVRRSVERKLERIRQKWAKENVS
jgi:DNA-directed RNA polymerase specialized sigma24 family protein